MIKKIFVLFIVILLLSCSLYAGRISVENHTTHTFNLEILNLNGDVTYVILSPGELYEKWFPKGEYRLYAESIPPGWVWGPIFETLEIDGLISWGITGE